MQIRFDATKFLNLTLVFILIFLIYCFVEIDKEWLIKIALLFLALSKSRGVVIKVRSLGEVLNQTFHDFSDTVFGNFTFSLSKITI